MSVAVQPSGDLHSVPSLLRRRPLIGFFGLAFGFSWLEVIVLGASGVPAPVVIGLTTVGPTFAAVVMTVSIEGRPGLRRLARRLAIWRVGVRWQLVALFAVPLVYLLATLLMPDARADFHPAAPAPWLVEYLILMTAGAVVGGPLLEEPGWRGFALPRLQARWGPLGGTLVLGLVWGLWHLPQFFVPAWADQNGGLRLSSIAVFLLTVVSIATIMTWIFNHTRGSLLIAVLVHASVNTSQLMLVNRLFPRMASTEVNALIGFGITALVLIVVTRGRLGHQGAQTQPPS